MLKFLINDENLIQRININVQKKVVNVENYHKIEEGVMTMFQGLQWI
jgi:hypothetical protein